MKKELVVVMIVVGAFSATAGMAWDSGGNSAVVVVPGTEYGLGLLYQDPREIPGAVILQEVPVAPGAPDARTFRASVDLSQYFPPVRSQGAQGSCVAFSLGYYLRTYVEWQERGWDVTDPLHQFSPAFLYNQVNGGVDGGSYFYDVIRIMQRMGCATWAQWPYSQGEYTRWPTRSEYLEAMPYRVGQHYWIWTGDQAGIDAMRQLLLNNTAIVLAMYCWSNFVYIENFNNIYCASERYGTNYGGHGIAIVGFDDSLVTNDGMGAFRVINSWGTSWGDSGLCWMTYQAVQDSFCSQRWAALYDDRIGYQPTVIAEANLTHPRRGNIDVVIGTENHNSPMWQACVLGSLNVSQYWYRDTLHSFTADTFCFDLTDGDGWLTNGRDVYLGAGDAVAEGVTGTIDRFTVGTYAGGVWGASSDPPVSIPDLGWAYAYLTLVVGVEETPLAASASPPGLLIYPNPADAWAEVRLLGSGAAGLQLTLYDVTGRRVATLWRGKEEENLRLDTQTLTSGQYFLHLETGEQRLSRKVLVIH